jgi:hypothetical protein
MKTNKSKLYNRTDLQIAVIFPPRIINCRGLGGGKGEKYRERSN